MKISKIQLTNFKRFTDLTVEQIPDTAKLVLLIGSNGSGKSSLFDAFGFVDASIKRDVNLDTFFRYCKKNQYESTFVSLMTDNEQVISLNDAQFVKANLPLTTFYGRTSFRQIPQLTRTALGQGEKINFEKDSDRPKMFIHRDNRFENDIEHIVQSVLKDFFSGKDLTIRQKYIEPINRALTNIFGSGNGTKLQLIEIIPPIEGKVAQITFRKGTSEMHYDVLSAGEKEVFNLLINLLSRAELYQDTIYFLDEMDLHLNTKLQFNLLREIIENWIPENCQLWIASHSLGFIEYARQSDTAAIIDFDDLDFDLPRTLTPEPKDNPDIYEIAVGKAFLPALFQQMDIFFVENTDKHYYAAIGIPKTIFISDNNRNSVYHKVRTSQYRGIVGRDFLSDDDRTQIEQHYPALTILAFYSIENYLYHPDNLAEYHAANNRTFDKNQYIEQLTIAKNEAIDAFIPTLALKRTEYPYFGEPEYNGQTLQNRFKNKQENQVQSTQIAADLKSDVFERYYKNLPMKTYCTQLPQRQNIPKSDLAKTLWFKTNIKNLLIQK